LVIEAQAAVIPREIEGYFHEKAGLLADHPCRLPEHEIVPPTGQRLARTHKFNLGLTMLPEEIGVPAIAIDIILAEGRS
jgi:hypothetical protein